MKFFEELPDIEETTANVLSSLLPAKSKLKYGKIYPLLFILCEIEKIRKSIFVFGNNNLQVIQVQNNVHISIYANSDASIC